MSGVPKIARRVFNSGVFGEQMRSAFASPVFKQPTPQPSTHKITLLQLFMPNAQHSILPQTAVATPADNTVQIGHNVASNTASNEIYEKNDDGFNRKKVYTYRNANNKAAYKSHRYSSHENERDSKPNRNVERNNYGNYDGRPNTRRNEYDNDNDNYMNNNRYGESSERRQEGRYDSPQKNKYDEKMIFQTKSVRDFNSGRGRFPADRRGGDRRYHQQNYR